MAEESLRADLTLKAEINLYYDLFIPENISFPAPLLIAVHGYGMNKRYMMREARKIAPESWVIASLQGPHQHFQRTGDSSYKTAFAWLTDYKSDEYIELHQKFILDLIDKLLKEAVIDDSKIVLFGFSQSSALNFRFVFTHPAVMTGVVAICGAAPSDIETNASYNDSNAQTLYLYSTDDEYYSLERFERFDAQLSRRLPNYRSIRYEAKHEITDQMRSDIAVFLNTLS